MTAPTPRPAPRSVLFVPANRLDLAAKVGTSGADAVCFDLEDAVPAQSKAAARESLAESVTVARQSRLQVHVRVNADLEIFADDLSAALDAGIDGIVLPKARGPEHIALVCEAIERLDQSPNPVTLIAMVENVAAIDNLRRGTRTPHARLSGVLFGPEDYCADLGALPDGGVLDPAFFAVVELARLLGVQAFGFPGSIAEFHDLEAFAAWVARGRGFGAVGAFCIHPKQVPILNDAFSASDDEIAWARRVTAAFSEAGTRGDGVVALDGQMIDRPVVERAKRILARVDAADAAREGIT